MEKLEKQVNQSYTLKDMGEIEAQAGINHIPVAVFIRKCVLDTIYQKK
jgi:hypothetical protein